MRVPVLLALLLVCPAVLAADGPLRKTVVLQTGEQLVHTAGGQIATLATPAGTNQGKNEVVRYSFEQYDSNIALSAVKAGEIKLLIEYTDQQIHEVVNVIVTDKATAERYRYVVSSLAGVTGISPEDVQLSGEQIAITGSVYSVTDLNRCIGLESHDVQAVRGKKPAVQRVHCLARLSSAAPLVFPDQGYMPRVNLQVEQRVPAGETSEATERASQWNATVRLGDVPVLTLTARDRAPLVSRVTGFSGRLNAALTGWKKQLESNQMYPATFNVRQVGGAYELGMVWKYDQGRQGEALIRVTPEELQAASTRSGGGSDRLVQWWAAILQDAFRLYFLAHSPKETAGSSEKNPLILLYQNAVRLAGASFGRPTAAAALGRSYFSLKSSSGADPFENLLTQPPAQFQPSPIAR